MKDRVILSLCDYSGVWPSPYSDLGFKVVTVDLKTEGDVRYFEYLEDVNVVGIMAAPPCTHFTVSGAQYWKEKDSDGRTLEGLSVLDACLRMVAIYEPNFWVLENPVGRLNRWLGKPKMYFDPYEYAGYVTPKEARDYANTLCEKYGISRAMALTMASNRYTKKTGLWGNFNTDLQKNSRPVIQINKQGSYTQSLGGSSERTKELRSITPLGFSRAFCKANFPKVNEYF